MKKRLLALLIALTLACTGAALAACAKEEEPPRSGLTGTFNYNEILRTNKVFNEKTGEYEAMKLWGGAGRAQKAEQDGDLYCTVYPFDRFGSGVDGAAIVSYGVTQRLRLVRDFTYTYRYTIELKNAQSEGLVFAQIVVSFSGTFTYTDPAEEQGSYEVTLSDPTAGTLSIYGATVSREPIAPTDLYFWTMNGAPSYVLDVADEIRRDPAFEPNRYLKGRTVHVKRGGPQEDGSTTESVVTDDIFYQDIMNDIAPYCNYTF